MCLLKLILKRETHKDHTSNLDILKCFSQSMNNNLENLEIFNLIVIPYILAIEKGGFLSREMKVRVFSMCVWKTTVSHSD